MIRVCGVPLNAPSPAQLRKLLAADLVALSGVAEKAGFMDLARITGKMEGIELALAYLPDSPSKSPSDSSARAAAALLREQWERAVGRLSERITPATGLMERARLTGKADGVRLALSYLDGKTYQAVSS